MAVHFPEIPTTFIHIPKTGGTSFRDWSIRFLKEKMVVYKGKIFVDHPNSDEIRKLQGIENLGNTFTFVRNPYDRLVSIFHYQGQKFVQKKNILINRLGKQEQRDRVFEEYLHSLKMLRICKEGFGSFVRRISSNQESDIIHLVYTPQTYWLLDPIEVFKIENINNEFHKIQKMLNCSEPLPRSNTSQHDHYRKYYNDTTKKIATKLFEEELDLFGYTF